MKTSLDGHRLAAERLDRIRRQFKRHHTLRVDELAQQLAVSPATIRRDLLELDRRGFVRRVHGGAVAVENVIIEPFFDDKTSIAAPEKEAIAHRALSCIDPNETIYLDGGSTVLALAGLIQGMTSLKVVTNSLRVASLLSAGGPELVVVGGELRRLSQTFVGPLTASLLDSIHVDKAFMGTIGLSADAGLTTTDPDEAFTKKKVLSRAGRVFLLADHTKLGKVTFAQAGSLGDVDTLITDSEPGPEMRAALKKHGVEWLAAASEGTLRPTDEPRDFIE